MFLWLSTKRFDPYTRWLFHRIWSNRRITPELEKNHPDSKVHGANMGPIWGRQDPGGPHVGPMDFVIWAAAE